jgi:hypothetical protein
MAQPSLLDAPPATPEQEVEHLLHLYDRDAAKIMSELQSQLSILANRAQTLLSLAGITITVTGFSGTSIAKAGPAAAALIVLGLVLVLMSAAIAMNGILRVRWTTSLAPCELADAVRVTIAVRDHKTRRFDLALRLLVVGLGLYVSSVGLLLVGSVRP